MRREDADRSLSLQLDWGERRAIIIGQIRSRAEANELIKFLEFIKAEDFLPDTDAKP